MNTKDNIFYTKLRDDIAEKANRITKIKKKELEAQNEKMYGKLIHILRHERSEISKTRSQVGPSTLNEIVRKQGIKRINRENLKMSEYLSNIQPIVPTFEKL